MSPQRLKPDEGRFPSPHPHPETAQKWTLLLSTGFHYLDNLLAFVLSIPQFVFGSGQSGGGGEACWEVLPPGC